MQLKPTTIGAACAGLVGLLVAGTLGCGGSGQRAAAPKVVVSEADLKPAKELQLARKIVPAAERSGYLGTPACTGCHKEQALHEESRHARTLARANPAVDRPRFEEGTTAVDQGRGTHYEVGVLNGRCTLRATSAGQVFDAEPDYAFGSGNVGVTYVSRKNGVSKQLRLSWFPGHGWGWTPGLGLRGESTEALGQKLSPKFESDCFSCHTTVLVREKGRLDLDRSILGIGCETCHGPGREHVEAVKRKQKDDGMLRLGSRRLAVTVSLCAACHRGPSEIDLNNPHAMEQLPRFQGPALALSRCFREGGLGCTDCHDPHQDAEQTSHETYAAVCRSCHTSTATVSRSQCPVQPRGDCVSCHMPRQSTPALPKDRMFTNHWIRVWEEKEGSDEDPAQADAH
jgi:predicted CXXCH cytochrome family protein